MRTPILAGNWKMHKTIDEAIKMVSELKVKVADVKDRQVIVCPVFTALSRVHEFIKDSNIELGAQNVHWEQKGAFTGEVSVEMIRDTGCKYIIIGHSERRQYFGETDETVNKRVNAVFSGNLLPIVCVGETLQEREKDLTFKVVEKQVHNGLKGLGEDVISSLIVAYEPVWAIGTGKTATPEQAEEVHKFIRDLLKRMYGEGASHAIRILYGGSVKPSNVKELMSKENIDGGLVGGASLDAESFSQIIKY
ncbi:MAG: triose-phosphate isomerase [bacterium]